MPTNLNALIRYKTINNCLSTGRKYDIDELIDACSDALTEYCGRKTGVSERTIREDLRVMRSEILGFNAPIEQKDGLYYYSDMSYSLVNIMMADEDLLRKVYNLLKEVSKKVHHPEMEDILKRLGTVKVRTSMKQSKPASEFEEIVLENRMPEMLSFRIPRTPKPSYPTWGEIFRILG
jgi:predicted DNA-binding transcriptional regulator YafY